MLELVASLPIPMTREGVIKVSETTGSLFIVSAPSGAGKSSLIAALLKRYSNDDMAVSVSHTTRQPRPGEIDGQHYHFVDKAQFQALIDDGAFYEWAEVFGNFYGTSKAAIAAQLQAGIDVFLDIDWQGAQQVRQHMPTAVSIFILPPSATELEQRLRTRGQDTDEVIAARMAKARAEISHYKEYDYQIINASFDTALSDLWALVRSTRLRTARQVTKHGVMLSELLAK